MLSEELSISNSQTDPENINTQINKAKYGKRCFCWFFQLNSMITDTYIFAIFHIPEKGKHSSAYQ